MINVGISDYNQIICFWLIFTRWLAILMQLPIFDNNSIPQMVKVLFCLLLSFAFFPALNAEVMKDIMYVGIDNFWALTIFYTLTGLIVGFLVKSIMSIFISAGSIITQQIGFGAVRYFDPTAGQQVGPFEQLIQWTLLIMILGSGALIPMFKGGFNSFFAVHIYDLGKMAQSPEFFFEIFKGIFLASLMLASPLIFINMLIMAVLGIVSRTVPQMNVIMVSFVVNIGLGLLVFAAGSDEFFHVAFKTYTDKLGEWFQFVI